MKNNDLATGVVELTVPEVTEHPFLTEEGDLAFYRLLCRQALGQEETEESKGLPEQVKLVDCRKLCVASNIQDGWYDYAKENGIDTVELTMLLLMNGPKVNGSLADNCVELQEGWLELYEDATEAAV